MASTPVAVRLADPLKARIRTLADQRRRPMRGWPSWKSATTLSRPQAIPDATSALV